MIFETLGAVAGWRVAGQVNELRKVQQQAQAIEDAAKWDAAEKERLAQERAISAAQESAWDRHAAQLRNAIDPDLLHEQHLIAAENIFELLDPDHTGTSEEQERAAKELLIRYIQDDEVAFLSEFDRTTPPYSAIDLEKSRIDYEQNFTSAMNSHVQASHLNFEEYATQWFIENVLPYTDPNYRREHNFVIDQTPAYTTAEYRRELLREQTLLGLVTRDENIPSNRIRKWDSTTTVPVVTGTAGYIFFLNRYPLATLAIHSAAALGVAATLGPEGRQELRDHFRSLQEGKKLPITAGDVTAGIVGTSLYLGMVSNHPGAMALYTALVGATTIGSRMSFREFGRRLIGRQQNTPHADTHQPTHETAPQSTLGPTQQGLDL